MKKNVNNENDTYTIYYYLDDKNKKKLILL